MTRYRRTEITAAVVFLLPFLLTYSVLFIWPTIQLFLLSFQKAPLIGEGQWVWFKNYSRLWNDKLFATAIWNTLYFVLLTVIPSTLLALAFITIWWGIGFNVLLFIAGLRNISSEIYAAAELDGATRWHIFRRITWPLIWPITVLVATIQLILQLKIFDQIYLFGQGGRTDSTLGMVEHVYRTAFQKNQGGYAAAATMVLFLVIVVVSVLQFQLARARGQK